MKRRSMWWAAALWLVATHASAQSTVFVVRHAERADMAAATPASDPDLSAAGRARAESLARMLADAGIGAVFVTEYKRTQQTAAPLAQARRLTPTIIVAKDTAALVARLKQSPVPVLVVGHSNTVPEILTALGASPAVTIPDTEYDNLFIVPPSSPVIRLRFH